MGNWRTVNIIGTCEAGELPVLKYMASYDRKKFERFGPLSTGESLCGLDHWPAENMNVSGNLAERDYSVEDVATHLRELVLVAPSLNLKIHCGGEHESLECVATITVEKGLVTVGLPECQEIRDMSAAETNERITILLFKR